MNSDLHADDIEWASRKVRELLVKALLQCAAAFERAAQERAGR